MTLRYSGVWLSGLAVLFPASIHAKSPDLMLAKHYHQDVEVNSYLVSEKLDGMRAYWTGTKFLSRNGNKIHAPDWFTRNLPNTPMDGELWIGRGQFQELMTIVRDQEPDEMRWRKVKFMAFDLPMSLNPFYVRQKELLALIDQLDAKHVEAIEQLRVKDNDQLQTLFKSVTEQGAEGLMLKRFDSPYMRGRSSKLLKMKSYQDAEAVVIAHLPGQGKYEGMMGSLLVRDARGREFKLGTGFSDAQRRNPPEIGATVTYRHNGFTDGGTPRFARFDRTYISL